MEVTQKLFDAAFPHGVSVYQGQSLPVVDVPKVQVRTVEEETFGLGWAYPNKDYVLIFDKATEEEHGWWVHGPDGEKYFLQSISEERQADALAQLDSGF